jgi:2-aminoadipate transaminase
MASSTSFTDKYTDKTNAFYGQYVVPPAEELVKFNVGQPSPSILPLDIVKKGMSYVQNIQDPSVLQYGDIAGYKQFRECLAKFLVGQYNQPVSCNELFITNGITQAITFICSLMMHAGSTVYVEEPTYFLAINIFKELGLKIVSIPIEEDGINLDILEREITKNMNAENCGTDFEEFSGGKCEKTGSNSGHYKSTKNHMLYTIPTFHNPTSYTMSHEKRLRLAELTYKYNKFFVLADEVYQMLYFDELDKPPMPMCYYTDKAISMGSFSKILSPGLRLGWIQTKNKDFMNILTKSGQYDSSGGSSPITQAIVHGVIGSGDLDNYILTCRQFLKANCMHMADKIQEKLRDFVDFVVPTGGYFVWLKIKQNINVPALLKLSEKYKIMIAPGSRFSANSKCENYIRLSFSYYNLEGINIGVERLCELFKFVQTISNKCLVAVLGYNGKLGSKIVQAIEQNQNQNHNVMFIEGIGRDFKLENVDLYSVIIDVSRPEGTYSLLKELLKRGKKIPLIIGTTGALPNIDELIHQYSQFAPVSIVSNFSRGIPQLLNLIEEMNVNEWDISMTEKHHIHKVDKPSGTALSLQKATGKSFAIESIREGEIIGDHILTFERPDEKIIFEHHAKNRELFANGALQYCHWIIKQKPGVYHGMQKNKLKFAKYTGCGNDFIIVDDESFQKFNMSKQDFVLKYSSRGTSIGADGVIFVNLNNKHNTIFWEYYNSDGYQVSMCGNGARCVVQYALDNGFDLNDNTILKNGDAETPIIVHPDGKLQQPSEASGTFSVLIYDNFSFQNVTNVICPELQKDYDNFALIDMRVPHMVFKIPSNTENLSSPVELGKKVRGLGYITNTNLYTEKNGKLYIKTYERGVWDETLACGTGCCAVAFYEALTNKKLGSDIEYELVVKSEESIFVKICPSDDAKFKIYLRGPAVKVFDGFI